MRALPRMLSVAALGLLATGCNGRSILGGSTSPNGDPGNKTQQPQQKDTQNGGGGVNETEPAGSVSGRPSTASDNGSPSAVSHGSVAEPGAPEGTVPSQPQNRPQRRRHSSIEPSTTGSVTAYAIYGLARIQYLYTPFR